METIRDIAVDMDSHVRYGPAGKSAEQIAYQVATINRALEEIRVLCPQELRATIPLVWTPGVSIMTAVAGYALGPDAGFSSYAAGCSLNVDGDKSFNELTMAGDGAVASTMLFPYTGTPGSKLVTIYGDCVKLGATVDRVLGAELLHERRPLQIIGSRANWLAYQRLNSYGYRDYDYGINTITPNIIRVPGVPRGMWLETCLNGNVIEYRAHCAPLPNDTFRATLDVAIMAQDITADDLASDSITVSGTLTPDVTGVYAFAGVGTNTYNVYVRNGSEPFAVSVGPSAWRIFRLAGTSALWNGPAPTSSPAGSYSPSTGATGTATITASTGTTRPVPGHRVYGILRAICLWHWSGSPWFRNDAARKVIEQEYLNATQQAQAIRPTASTSIQTKVVY